MLAHVIAGLVPLVDPGPRAAGDDEPGDVPGRGREPALRRVLRIDPRFYGMALQLDVVLRKRQRVAAGHEELQAHQVEARNQLGYRVFDLQAGVHLQEVELPVLVNELHGPGILVAAPPSDPDRRLADIGEHADAQVGSRSLLDQLLVPALDRAVAGAQVDDVAIGVGKDLHLHVARPEEVLLQVALWPAKALLRLPLRRLQGVGRLGGAS